jgi:predicted RNase H-related nuclease YkuK (DUF458 family)
MKIAVFVDNFIETNILENIKKFFLKQDPHKNIFVSNLHAMQNQVKDTAVVNRYHLKWNNANGSIMFLTIEDASKYSKDYPMCEKYVLLEKENLKNITKELIENCTVLILSKNNNIRKAKNAELQSNVRH